MLCLRVAFTWGCTAPQGLAGIIGEHFQIQFPKAQLCVWRDKSGELPASATCGAQPSPEPQTKHLLPLVGPSLKRIHIGSFSLPIPERELVRATLAYAESQGHT